MFEYSARLMRVVDGDTVDLDVDLGFRTHMVDRFRLRGIDAPEMKGETVHEGRVARDWLVSRLSGPQIVVKTHQDSRGKYGRWLATLFVNGRDINQEMVAAGHARPWQ